MTNGYPDPESSAEPACAPHPDEESRRTSKARHGSEAYQARVRAIFFDSEAGA